MRRSIRNLAENVEKCPYSPTSSPNTPPRTFSEIPGPREIPVIGNIGYFKYAVKSDAKTIENYNQHLEEMYKKYGKIVKENLGFGRKYVVHIFDPADVQTVLAADGKTPFIVPLQETTQKYREMKGMNPGLGNLNGPEWYRLRSSVQHAMMRPQSVQTYLPFSQIVSNDLVCHVADQQKRFGLVDMQKVAGRWSLESAGQILFEKSLGSLGNRSEWADGLIELNKKIFQLSANKDMRFASYLINRKELNRRDVKTAPMLIYNLYNLATHPEALKEIQKEIKEDPASSKLTFLRACIKETFRMFPIGTEVSRVTQKNLILSGYEVPAGTAVDINTNVLMRHEVLFSDSPREFKPQRWLEKSKEVHPFAYLPFGFGPRMCAGRRFAEQDLLTSLAKLCGNYDIRHRGDPITQIYETLLLPRGDCTFEFKKL
nr:hypothetical protein ZK177.5 - Caenorhabditis elegans [Caenorhabditis elegans]